jgi:RNA polymerase sigma-70 factor (ECF subfamily)
MPALADELLLDLFARHRNELRLHCYRMLGSSHDADDVLQEVAVRAWRSKASLLDVTHVRAWLYRITTNVCLDELKSRRRRCLPFEAGPATSDPNATLGPPDREAFVEPCPDSWFGGVASDPAARFELHEGVRLAFVAALQHLTPSQRATLLLRDVVGLSAEETAAALELGLQATNSALFRARAAVEARLAHDARAPARPAPQGSALQSLLERYLAAWNQIDVEAFVGLLHDEVKTTMPPVPTWIAGKPDNVAFYRPMFAAQRPGAFVAVPTAANGQPAFAFYRMLAAGEPHRLRAIQLVEVRDGAIASIDHFMLPELASAFDLPSELPDLLAADAGDGRPCLDLALAAIQRAKR